MSTLLALNRLRRFIIGLHYLAKLTRNWWLCVKAVTEPDSAESTENTERAWTEPTENSE